MSFVMPFGKYKGRPLKDCPREYVMWIYDQRQQEMQEFESFLGIHKPAPSLNGIGAKLSDLRRRLAKQYHPDRGGSNEAMSICNSVLDEVSKLLQES